MNKLNPNNTAIIKHAQEQQMALACKAGDRLAQEEVYARFSKKMYAVCMRYAKDAGNAEDILIEGFTKVFLKIDTYNGHGSFEGWIRSIIVNCALTAYHKSLRSVRTTSMYDVLVDEPAWFQQEDASNMDYLLKGLQSLPDQYRMAFNMFVLEGYTHQEIGLLLDIEPALSKVRVSRARKMLQSRLQLMGQRISKGHYAA